MMDEQRDRIEEILAEAAQDYHAPPPTPKAEMWERIRAAREAARAGATREHREAIPLYPLAPRAWWTRPALRYGAAAAAILAIGVALGRLSTRPAPDGFPPVPRMSALDTAASKQQADGLPTRMVAAQHLTEVDAFLTEFRAEEGEGEFGGQARRLLGTTRLLLDSRKVGDSRLRYLLQDLEIVLAQIATFDSTDRRNELDLIADGIAQTQLRSRIRSAIPAGPIVQM